jgi:hypothetical protein
MRFVVDELEFDFEGDRAATVGEAYRLDASTSVNYQKAHYFDALYRLGELRLIKASDSDDEVLKICSSPDTIVAAFHEVPRNDIPCRLLQHTKGGLMLTGGFLDGWAFREATMNLVTSKLQADQLHGHLGSSAPRLAVFSPRLSHKLFHRPSDNEAQTIRQSRRVGPDDVHLVYAGRWIANKGICQAVRALNIWPLPGAHLTLVGQFEPNFLISQSNSLHVTFECFFQREVVERNHNIKLVLERSVPQKDLCEIFWSADAFLYPSFHEDENFGMAPREAILSGVPAVVTDFCGLGQLGRSTLGGLVSTYPTLGGVRYSLRSLRHEIGATVSWSGEDRREFCERNVKIVTDECDQDKALDSLRSAAVELLRTPPEPPPIGGWRSKSRVERWARIGPPSFREAIALGDGSPPEGLFVDGTGWAGEGWYSDPHFLRAIQGFHTTFSRAPRIDRSSVTRGFWRVALWREERALVEFGFPGPRIKRFSEREWKLLANATLSNPLYEPAFQSVSNESVELLQELVELGYLVPDELP